MFSAHSGCADFWDDGRKDLGWGLLSQFPPFRYFPIFSALSNHTLFIEYHVYIWQVSPQVSCGDTCQIWMLFEEFNMCFCQVENFAYGEINERSFSNPHPCPYGYKAWTPINPHGYRVPQGIKNRAWVWRNHSTANGFTTRKCPTNISVTWNTSCLPPWTTLLFSSVVSFNQI